MPISIFSQRFKIYYPQQFFILNKIRYLILTAYARLCLCCKIMCYQLLPSVNCLEVGRKSIASSTNMNSMIWGHQKIGPAILFSLTKTSKYPISKKGVRLSGKVVSKSFIATASIRPIQFMSLIQLLTVLGCLVHQLCQI